MQLTDGHTSGLETGSATSFLHSLHEASLMETGFTRGSATRLAHGHPRPLLCPVWTRHTGTAVHGPPCPHPPSLSASEAHSLLKMALKAEVPTGAVPEHSPLLRGSQTF